VHEEEGPELSTQAQCLLLFTAGSKDSRRYWGRGSDLTSLWSSS